MKKLLQQFFSSGEFWKSFTCTQYQITEVPGGTWEGMKYERREGNYWITLSFAKSGDRPKEYMLTFRAGADFPPNSKKPHRNFFSRMHNEDLVFSTIEELKFLLARLYWLRRSMPADTLAELLAVSPYRLQSGH